MAARSKLLVTRPMPDATRTAAHLKALDIEPVLAPMLSARAVAFARPDPERFTAIAATSANAIRFLCATRPDSAIFSKPLYAVGGATALEARQAGFATVLEARGTLADLARLILERHEGGTIYYPSATHRSGDLSDLLEDRYGIDLQIVYEMMPTAAVPDDVHEALIGGEIAGALFFSRRTAEVFAQLTSAGTFAPVRAALQALCLSETCAEPLVQHHFLRISLADQPSHEAMMALALAFVREQISP